MHGTAALVLLMCGAAGVHAETSDVVSTLASGITDGFTWMVTGAGSGLTNQVAGAVEAQVEQVLQRSLRSWHQSAA